MNLLMFNLAVDSEHVTLAFGQRWIEGLAKHFDRIDIVTMYEGKHALPANVHVVSAGREQGLPLWRRILRFYWLTTRILIQQKPSLAFAHMIPEFALLFWPLKVLTRTPCILWYAHGHVPRNLRIAHALVDHVVSSTPQGFRLPSDKVTFLGQGIEAGLYAFRTRTPSKTLRLISVGRLAPSKGQDTIIEALALWGQQTEQPWHITFVGGPTDANEEAFAQKIYAQAAARLPAGSFTFTGRMDADKIAALLAESDLSLSLGTTGSLDKTIVESMASGCPIFSCNDAFRAIAQNEGLQSCVIDATPAPIAQALSRFASLSAEQRLALAQKQSAIALRDHTLDGLIQRIVSVLLSFVPSPEAS